MIREGHIRMALERRDHNGWGYALTRDRGPAFCKKLDKQVVRRANELELTPGELFHWTNSKCGRWLDDRLRGKSSKADIAEAVDELLSPGEMNVLAGELGWERRWDAE